MRDAHDYRCRRQGIRRPVRALDYSFFQSGRTIRGIIEGDSIPQDFIPRLIDLHLAGRFPFDKLVKRYSFAQIQNAVDDSEHGDTLKAVLIL